MISTKSIFRTIRFLAIVLLLVACNTQKRKYLKGYYFEGVTKHHNQISTRENPDSSSSCVNQFQASSKNEIDLVPKNNKVLITNSPIANCDTIILTNGVKMIVKVISAGEQTVIYKSCEGNKDEFLNIERSKISSIHYSSGNKADENTNGNNQDPYNQPTKPFNSSKNAEAEKGVKQLEKATTWFILSRYIGFGFIVGFIFATCAKNNLKGKVGYESEFKAARTLHILGLVLLLVMLIPIIYLLVLLFLV